VGNYIPVMKDTLTNQILACYEQCCGSGWIRNYLQVRLRIQIQVKDLFPTKKYKALKMYRFSKISVVQNSRYCLMRLRWAKTLMIG
jgi:hypothetical protein